MAARSSRLTQSSGVLMFRLRASRLEVLLVHPGGPFWRGKDIGAWTIPKGELAGDENLLARAQTEFHEELGIAARGEFIPLGSVKQKAGKTVRAWAFEGDLPDDFVAVSNTFEVEWPPRSGRVQTFPEVDAARFFPVPEARQKLNPAQTAFLDRLLDARNSVATRK
jgi:predicted NUDIX family NTP pyrophosphohydrolase